MGQWVSSNAAVSCAHLARDVRHLILQSGATIDYATCCAIRSTCKWARSDRVILTNLQRWKIWTAVKYIESGRAAEGYLDRLRSRFKWPTPDHELRMVCLDQMAAQGGRGILKQFLNWPSCRLRFRTFEVGAAWPTGSVYERVYQFESDDVGLYVDLHVAATLLGKEYGWLLEGQRFRFGGKMAMSDDALVMYGRLVERK